MSLCSQRHGGGKLVRQRLAASINESTLVFELACLMCLQRCHTRSCKGCCKGWQHRADSCGRNASLSPAMQLGCEGLVALRRRHGSTLINGVVAFEGYDPQGLAPTPLLFHRSQHLHVVIM